jgi:hypothetical protein
MVLTKLRIYNLKIRNIVVFKSEEKDERLYL